jgi:hypothetical protein
MITIKIGATNSAFPWVFSWFDLLNFYIKLLKR